MEPNKLTTEQADAIFRATDYLDDLEDYAYEPGLGHVYGLFDGRQVLVLEDGSTRILDDDDFDSTRLVVDDDGRMHVFGGDIAPGMPDPDDDWDDAMAMAIVHRDRSEEEDEVRAIVLRERDRDVLISDDETVTVIPRADA